MGQRRIRNLLGLGVSRSQIYGFDFSPAQRRTVRAEYGVIVFSSLRTAVKKISPDVYIISTPPHLHHQYFLHAAKLKKHFFVEVATTDRGYNRLYPLLDDSFVAAPSFTFRYFEPIKSIKKLLDQNKIGRVWAFNHHL